jgi:hypothetical protein
MDLHMEGSAFLLAMAVLVVYFLPTIIASKRHHHNSSAIFVLNLLLGWTFLGWIGSLVWSVTYTSGETLPVAPTQEKASYFATMSDRQMAMLFWIGIGVLFLLLFVLLNPI